MDTTLMRFSARKAMEKGNISRQKYSQILSHIERMEKQKIVFDEKTINEARRNITQHLVRQ